MKIAIIGATGTIGQRITNEALERGHEVKALLRDPERIAKIELSHPKLSVAQVDIFDPASVAAAIADVDVVVNATGARAGDIRKFYVDSTNAVIEGVKRAGNKRLLVVGGAGSLEVAPQVFLADTPAFPEMALPIARAQRETLYIFRDSNIEWTFFSPSALIAPGRRTGKYRLGTDQLLTNDHGESYISAEDYAVALLDEIENPQFIRQRFTAVSLEK
jgi:putative NADH-flavin reductase